MSAPVEGCIKVSGRTFEWWILRNTKEYDAANRDWGFDRPQPINVVRIREPGTGFDIAIRIHYPREGGARICYLEQFALVLDSGFPSQKMPVPTGHLIRLRPKLCWVPDAEPGPRSVERVVQWILSAHFRPFRVSLSGLRWNGRG